MAAIDLLPSSSAGYPGGAAARLSFTAPVNTYSIGGLLPGLPLADATGFGFLRSKSAFPHFSFILIFGAQRLHPP
jgi:hypothetical protein